jgi:hypothetical protein
MAKQQDPNFEQSFLERMKEITDCIGEWLIRNKTQPNTVDVATQQTAEKFNLSDNRPHWLDQLVDAVAKDEDLPKKNTTDIGYKNRNRQEVIGRTNLPGNDHLQYVYVLKCHRANCEHIYGANGTDIFERKCPKCDGGKPGLQIG